MRTLRSGHTGTDVEQWENFLTGLGYDVGEVDGTFDDAMLAAVKAFQASKGLDTDGIIGRQTWSVALAMGFAIIDDDGDKEETNSYWPPKPNFAPLSAVERNKLFGNFTFKANPVPGNPENIVITDGWAAKNIVTVDLPGRKVPFHAKAAPQLKALWAAWEAAGLLPLVLSWGGSWAPRFVRGSRTYLSNHAWGTAFDINVAQNGLGVQPALVGQPGSVRKLVPLANQYGFYWGGHFPGRPDGMHFEVAFLK